MNALALYDSEDHLMKRVMESILRLSAHDVVSDYAHIPLYQKISQKVENAEKLVFLLPAFPAKSPSPAKTCGIMPDLGEVIALVNLQKLCEEISSHYFPGAEILICSDGRVFSDVVDVNDETIDDYATGISDIIREFHLTKLKTFSMDDAHPDLTPSQLREKLLDQYAVTTDEVREKVLLTDEGRNLFNGMHRFMVEDQKGRSTQSKNQIHKEMKVRTYELIRRSDAWSKLLQDKFPDALRFSIHPHDLASEKFGVKLLTNARKWATPWHNVTVRMNGHYELMALEEALKRGARQKTFGGKYVYFELA